MRVHVYLCVYVCVQLVYFSPAKSEPETVITQQNFVEFCERPKKNYGSKKKMGFGKNQIIFEVKFGLLGEDQI